MNHRDLDSHRADLDENETPAKKPMNSGALTVVSALAIVAIGAAVISYVNANANKDQPLDASRMPKVITDLEDGWKVYKLPDIAATLEIPSHPTQSGMGDEGQEGSKTSSYYYTRSREMKIGILGVWYKSNPPTLNDFSDSRIAAIKANTSFKNVEAKTTDAVVDGLPAKRATVDYVTYGQKVACETCYICIPNNGCVAFECTFQSGRDEVAMGQFKRLMHSIHFDRKKVNS